MPILILRSLIVLVLLACAAPAAASRQQESIFEDEFQLLLNGAEARQRALDDVMTLGADTIRSNVLWGRVAPDGGSRTRPRGFDGRNPAAYPAEAWDPYDDIVRGTAARGISLLLSPSSPAPEWASRCKRGTLRTCKPDPRQFGDFVRALGKRYSGSYADENQGGGVLPRVERWSIWNEPNQPGWLTPQYEKKRGRLVPAAAIHYRALALAAIRALRATKHSGDEILLGETAPLGRTTGTLAKRPMPPGDFIRHLFCLDRRVSGCRKRPKFAVTGYAHHPYTRGGSQAPRTRSQPNEITIASPSRLKRLLDQGARAKVVPSKLDIFYTEFGFQTNPPDKLFGVSLARQSKYMNESDWITYNDARVKSVAQYKLVDEPNLDSFQTGLRFVSGEPKPAYEHYRLPIWVTRSGSGVKVYGQVRPPEDGSVEQVVIEGRARGGEFADLRTVTVASRKGHFLKRLRGRRLAEYRLRWQPASGAATVYSREAKVARR